MAEFKYFRNTLTGKVGHYPADFADLFYDTFVEVDSNAADCIDCKPTPEEFVYYADKSDDAGDSPDPVVTPTKNKDK